MPDKLIADKVQMHLWGLISCLINPNECNGRVLKTCKLARNA